MSSGWPIVKFGDCAEIVQEKVLPSTMGNALYIGLEHIGESTLSLSGEGIASDVTSTKTKFRTGDILFGKLRPYFRKVVQAPREGVCSTDIWAVRALDGVDQRYLYYCMASEEFVDFATAGSEGTRMPRATWEHVSRYTVSLPTLSEQRAIAHILGTLDDKIELNRRMNQTLEEMARALFKSWFVDFGPVRAKLEGQAPYLPPELWDLFPDDFVDSELGEIPEGWDVKTLSEVVTHLRTNENPSKYPDTLFSHFSIPAYDLGQVPKQDLGGSIKSSKTVVQPGVVLLSKLNPEIERVWLVDVAAGERAICSTEFLALSPRLPFPRSYVYCYFQTPAFRSLIQTLVTGTSKSHQRVQPSSVLSLPAIIPSEQVIDAFERQAEAFLANSLTRRRETTGLAAQRDALLPELVPGAWGIGDGGIHA